MRKS
jgi:hypothetical protein